jgi:hypothetical protein
LSRQTLHLITAVDVALYTSRDAGSLQLMVRLRLRERRFAAHSLGICYLNTDQDEYEDSD